MRSHLPKALVINRPERPDRRAYIEAHLKALGIEWNIVPAVNRYTPAGGHMNIATRNIWRNHLECWERIAREGRPYLVLEDDANIPAENVAAMLERWNEVEKQPAWHMLYFYSAWTKEGIDFKGICRVSEGSTHGYILNPARALASAEMLALGWRTVYQTGKKDWLTHIDQWLAKCVWTLQDWYCFGTEELVFRVDMGTDTGWKENRIEK